MANSVYSDEMACYKSSHQDLHCLHRYWFWSARLKRVIHCCTIRGQAAASKKEGFLDFRVQMRWLCLTISAQKHLVSDKIFLKKRQVDAIQMNTHNICIYKGEDKKYTDCNLKTKELLYCELG